MVVFLGVVAVVVSMTMGPLMHMLGQRTTELPLHDGGSLSAQSAAWFPLWSRLLLGGGLALLFFGQAASANALLFGVFAGAICCLVLRWLH